MRKSARIELLTYTNELRRLVSDQSRRLHKLGAYNLKKLKSYTHKNGSRYYKLLEPGSSKYVYLGTESNPEVVKIKEAHYLERSIAELTREISLMENVLSLSKDVSYESINSDLPKSYRGSLHNTESGVAAARQWKESMETYKKTFPPYRPEELTVLTRDGSYVRSRGEGLIYNYLLEIGVTFVYELPLRIRIGNKESLMLPDFTILSEIDYKTVIFIEHQGMMSTPAYREKFKESVYKYWINNYIPEKDVYFTFDLPNGGFDDTPVRNIIYRAVRPAATG